MNEGGIRKSGKFKSNDPNKPLVSIITVVYNGEKFIEQTINSVLNQTYLNVEYIIIDGGSIDSTLSIIRKFDSKIDYWISEPDKGISDAFNKGIRLSSGELIGIINADDWYEAKTVELAVNRYLISKSELFISFGNLYYPEINMVQYGDREYKGKIKYIMPQINHPSVFVSRQVYEMVGLFNVKYRVAMDFDFLKRCHLKKIQFNYINEILVNMRLTGISNQKFAGLGEILEISSNKFFTLILYIYFNIKWKFKAK